jgi:enamine deaminase RidA (YjgF/YER057c/UK114 family)
MNGSQEPRDMPFQGGISQGTIRTALISLILAGIIGLASMMWDSRASQIRIEANQENTRTSILALQAQMADIPSLATRVTRLEVVVDSNSRRLDANDSLKKLK